MFIDAIASYITDFLKDHYIKVEVNEYTLGVKYSYVEILCRNKNYLGLSITLVEDLVGSPWSFIEPSIDSLVPMATSINPYVKTLGIALLNALSQYMIWEIGLPKNLYLELDIDFFKAIASFIEEPVVVIGNMALLVRRLGEEGFRDIVVLERNPCYRMNCLPDTVAPRVIGRARTLIITGATIVNDTIDQILSLARYSKKILVGPTAAIYPKPVCDGLVDVIASMTPVDNDIVKKIIRAGGGRWSFHRYCRPYIIYGERI